MVALAAERLGGVLGTAAMASGRADRPARRRGSRQRDVVTSLEGTVEGEGQSCWEAERRGQGQYPVHRS
jgi:hypothetical protein